MFYVFKCGRKWSYIQSVPGGYKAAKNKKFPSMVLSYSRKLDAIVESRLCGEKFSSLKALKKELGLSKGDIYEKSFVRATEFDL